MNAAAAIAASAIAAGFPRLRMSATPASSSAATPKYAATIR